MKIKLNNEILIVPQEIKNLDDLLSWNNLSRQGTAIAIDDKLIRKDSWANTDLKENMDITIISAAFGG